MAAFQGIVAEGVVVDPHPEDLPPVTVMFGVDAMRAVISEGVVRHLDALRALEQDARPGYRGAFVQVAVMAHAVVVDRAARTLLVLDADLAVVIDVIAGGDNGACVRVAPDPDPVVVVDLVVPEGCGALGYLDAGRRRSLFGRVTGQGCKRIRAVMVDLGVLQEEAVTGVADPLVRVVVDPHVEDVEVRAVPLDGTPARWLAPVAALGPRNAEVLDRHSVCVPDVKSELRPVGVYFRAGPVRVDPLEDIPTIGGYWPRELVGSIFDGEGRGGRAGRCRPSKVLAGVRTGLHVVAAEAAGIPRPITIEATKISKSLFMFPLLL